MATVEAIYVGTREAMIAEVAAFDFTTIGIPARNCKYLIMPVGDAQWDAEYCGNIKDRDALAKDLAEAYGVGIVYL